MPTSERYARYRQDRTTIWASKRAAAFLAREHGPGESVTATVDRLLGELRRRRRLAAADRPRRGASATRGGRKGVRAERVAR